MKTLWDNEEYERLHMYLAERELTIDSLIFEHATMTNHFLSKKDESTI